MAVQPISSYLPAPRPDATLRSPTAREQRTAATDNPEAVDSASASTSSTVTASTDASATQAATQQQPSREQIDQAMKEVKQALPLPARNLQFSIDSDTGRTVVKVIDPSTKEVIRQIPSEELLAITKSLDSFTGLLVKQKA